MSPRRPAHIALFGVLTALLLGVGVLGLALGTVSIPASETFWILWGHKSGSSHQLILLQLRLPRVILGAASGAGLAICGCVMQGVFRNPLADPYLLGIAGGATSGAALCIALGAAALPLLVSLGALAGGILSVALVFLISQSRWGRFSNTTLILVGIAVGAMFSALTSLTTYFTGREQLQQIIFWMMGDLGGAVWSQLWIVLAVVGLGSLGLVFFSRELNALALGDEMAQHLGIEPLTIKRILLGLSTLLTAVIVAVTGTIGFVGLIVPHAMRLICGPDHRILLPASALAGAVFLVGCDIAARTLMRPLELPVGLITALCGAPFFLYLLAARKERM